MTDVGADINPMSSPLWSIQRIWSEVEEDKAFDHLRAHGSHFVPGTGRWDRPDVAFVGEAPGRHEDEQGEPFVGQSGKLLFHLVEEITGLTRDKVWTTNIVKYRPPNNRTPWPAELRAGARYLRRELALVHPRVTVTLGAAPLSVLQRPAISKVHGQPFGLSNGRTYLPLYHPAFLLRRRDLIDTFKGDLIMLARLIKEKPDA